jgi:hypothetical protein
MPVTENDTKLPLTSSDVNSARLDRLREIFPDVAFAGNDQLKTNIVLEMKSHGIEFHTA